jgi:acyl-CoA synthetase (NDP forming)
MAPRNVVLVGATDRPGGWAARVWSNLSRCGGEGKIYFVDPKRTELFGQPRIRISGRCQKPWITVTFVVN